MCAQCPLDGLWDTAVGWGASSQPRLRPSVRVQLLALTEPLGSWAVLGSSFNSAHPLSTLRWAAGAWWEYSSSPTHPLPRANPEAAWPIPPCALSSLSRNRPSVPMGCPGKPL